MKRWTNSDKLLVYEKLLRDINNNYDCDDTDSRYHDTQCRKCKAEAALSGKDPWGRDNPNNEWDIDEMAIGYYFAYVSGYSDNGMVGLCLFNPESSLSQAKNTKNVFEDTIYVQSKQMPTFPGVAIVGGNLITIEVLNEGGYQVVEYHGSFRN